MDHRDQDSLVILFAFSCRPSFSFCFSFFVSLACWTPRRHPSTTIQSLHGRHQNASLNSIDDDRPILLLGAALDVGRLGKDDDDDDCDQRSSYRAHGSAAAAAVAGSVVAAGRRSGTFETWVVVRRTARSQNQDSTVGADLQTDEDEDEDETARRVGAGRGWQ